MAELVHYNPGVRTVPCARCKCRGTVPGAIGWRVCTRCLGWGRLAQDGSTLRPRKPGELLPLWPRLNTDTRLFG